MDSVGVIEQYDGYLGLPMCKVDPDFHGEDSGFAVLKQADVLMIPYLMPGLFSQAQIEANYRFYEPRTSHRSSLSLAPHAFSAILAGKLDDAYRYFLKAVSSDLRNRWSTDDGGLHGAACASVPWVVMHGFCGMRVEGERLTFAPRLPEEWKSVSFTVLRQGSLRKMTFVHHESEFVQS